MSKHVTETSDSSFEQDVLQSDQPVLVDFWAEWCAPCRMIAPTVEAVAEKYAGSARVALNAGLGSRSSAVRPGDAAICRPRPINCATSYEHTRLRSPAGVHP